MWCTSFLLHSGNVLTACLQRIRHTVAVLLKSFSLMYEKTKEYFLVFYRRTFPTRMSEDIEKKKKGLKKKPWYISLPKWGISLCLPLNQLTFPCKLTCALKRSLKIAKLIYQKLGFFAYEGVGITKAGLGYFCPKFVCI